MNDLLLVGLSHRTAPVAVRERLAVSTEGLEAADRNLAALPGVREAVLVATCNRVEAYLVAAHEGAEGAADVVREHLGALSGLGRLVLDPHLYERRAVEGVHHLFRVASSLDSLVVGEPQILGQVKVAFDLALRCGSAGSHLRSCFQAAFRAARRVRRDTAIARNSVSVSSVAVDLARQVFGAFTDRRVLILGAGKMADLAARALRLGGARLTVANRTPARAEELAARIGAEVRSFDDLAGALEKADIVLASTGAREPIVSRSLVARVQKLRRSRRLCFIDIAVPRDVDPTCADIENVFVFDIDDLQKLVATHADGRRSEADRAEAIVEQEMSRFLESFRARSVGPVIAALRARYMEVAGVEADKLLGSMPGLDERGRRIVREAFEAAAKKLLHAPSVALKKGSEDGNNLVESAVRIFDLPSVTIQPGSDDEPAGEPEPSSPELKKAMP